MTHARGELGDAVSRKDRLRRVRKLTRLVREPSYRRGLRLGVAAAVEHEAVSFGLPFQTVIDVGAHHGQFALLALNRFPGAAIYCVEPLVEAQERLRSVVGCNPRVQILAVAASKAAGKAAYHVSRATDSSSLLPITAAYTMAFPGTEEVATEEAQTARLDELLPADELERPCLLKIDVQGSELDVLHGADGLLEHIDEIFVECSFVEFYRGQPLIDGVIDHVHARGFRLSGIYSVVRDARSRCLQADLLFCRR